MPIPTLEERLLTTLGGRYRVERELAHGGMSVIFQGRDLRAHRAVAIKLLKPSDSLDARRLRRFARETELTARLRHPNIVDVFDLGCEADGTPYLVMELLAGQTLAAALEIERVLSLTRMLEIVLPVMDALTEVHSAGVVHRDLKPDNVFLSHDARGNVVPKLLDFGIAKHADDAMGTRTGAVLGTPEYMAPEQIAGGQALPTTDVWALGAMLYRGLTGSAPYAGRTPGEVLARLSHEAAPLMAAKEVPAGVRAVIDRALLREPARRYPDVAEFGRALVLSATEAGIVVQALPAERFREHRVPNALGPSARTFTASAAHGTVRGHRRQIVALSAFAALAIASWTAQRSWTNEAANSRAAIAASAMRQSTEAAPIAAALGPFLQLDTLNAEANAIDAPPIATTPNAMVADSDPARMSSGHGASLAQTVHAAAVVPAFVSAATHRVDSDKVLARPATPTKGAWSQRTRKTVPHKLADGDEARALPLATRW